MLRSLLFSLLALLFFSFPSFAQESFRIESVQEYPQAKEQIANRFLRALQLNQRASQEAEEEASRLWRELKTQFSESSLIYHHYVRNRVIQGYSIPSGYLGSLPTKKLARTIALFSRFLFWNNNLTRAIQVVQQSDFSNLEEKTLAHLELAKLYLYSGKYQQAKELLFGMKTEDQDYRFQIDLLKEWYFILTRQFASLQQLQQKLEEDYLYIMLSLPLESQVAFLTQQEIQRELLKNLTRFPDQQVLLEQLILYYAQVQSWSDLNRLLRSSQQLRQGAFPKFPLPRLPILQEKWKEFQNFLPLIQEALTPLQKLEIQAQLAIALEDWEALEQIAKAFRRRYPQLLDGPLYLALFYQKTGQEEKRQSLLEEIRFRERRTE